MKQLMFLKHIVIWLSRITHCRGFGIQSPTDYAFVRYVVNEHWPYYSYTTLPDADWETRRLARLYFRLANWRQPEVIIDRQEESGVYAAYMKAGCNRAVIQADAPTVALMRLCLSGDYRGRLASALEKVDDPSVLIVERIYRDRDFWQDLVKDDRTRITFDLYYCGIVMFDKKREKHNYIINF